MKPFEPGVCSWSVRQPDLESTCRIVRRELNLTVMQLGFFNDEILDPAGDEDILRTVAESGIELSATCVGFAGEDYSSIQSIAATGGFVPADTFEHRLKVVTRAAEITRKLSLSGLTAHVGTIPSDTADAAYQRAIDNVRRVADGLGQYGVSLYMETGQEPADLLADFIEKLQRPNVKVNFDPANMILYGVGQPLEAVDILKNHIAHVHMKDAVWSDTPRKTWGCEVPLGTGDADIPHVVNKLRTANYKGPLVIERENTPNTIQDIRNGVELLGSLLA